MKPAAVSADAATAREYAAAREGAALVDLSDRGVLAVTGPLRQKFLHNVLSNDVEGKQPGQGALAALMDVKGRQLCFLRVLVEKDVVLLEAPADRLELLDRTLAHYRVAAPVRFAVRPTAVIGLLGPRAAEMLSPAGVAAAELPKEGHARGVLVGHGILVARASDLPGRGFVVHVAPEGAAAVSAALEKAGALAIGRPVLDALRIEAGRPWYGPDVTEENLLHETGLLAEYHSSSKGCYVGQETVARLEGRGGHVNKALRGLRLSAAARPGDAVRAEGRDVGRLTTAAVSPRLGPIAMGYLHRSHFVPGTAVEVNGRPATVTPLQLDAEGP